MPSSCSARITRTAISPRFATRTRLNIERSAVQRLELEQELAVLDRLCVAHVDLADDALDLGLDLVHQLHRLENAERLARRDRVTLLDERRLPGLRGTVERADHRALHAYETVVRRRADRRLRRRLRCGLRRNHRCLGSAPDADAHPFLLD